MLTEREREIFTTMLSGITAEKALADKLKISFHTLHTHVGHILSKAHKYIDKMNKAELLVFCAQFHDFEQGH